ncbi:MAG: IreB family regulatory phosphoprotein [Firmicutes bacterium]|nr:IreB family regulatory phosphoprotein [Bacillota bacterium]
MDSKDTILFTSPEKVQNRTIEEILNRVYIALEDKGYSALDQMVGYILSGDPSYITGHNNARNLIRQIERDDLVETLLRNFLNK